MGRVLPGTRSGSHLCDKWRSRHRGVPQVARRILGAMPASAQSLCASPFLDANLFVFDEKLISAQVRPRSFSEVPVKFAARSSPDQLRFQLHPAHFQAAPTSARPLKQLVTYHFHPVYPFVLGVLQTFVQPTQLLVYTRL